MLLVADVGNTTISLGVFDGESLKGDWRLATRSQHTSDELGVSIAGMLGRHIDLDRIEGVMASSVVPSLNEPLDFAFNRYLKHRPTFLNSDLGLLPLDVPSPSSVGSDRIADCLAGYELYGGPLLIADLGSASTFHLVSAEGAFLGGAIAPQMHSAANSLFGSTSQLFDIPLNVPNSVIGTTTEENLQAGIVMGFLDLVEGLIRRFKQEYDQPLKVIATGGKGGFFHANLDIIDAYEPQLTMIGLRLAWEFLQRRGAV
jgi:type III pantothenate kinase